MLRDGQEVSIDAVPFDSTQRTYVIKDGTTYKIDDGTSVIYAGVSGILKGYRVFFGTDNKQVELKEGDSLTIKDNKYFSGIETETTIYTTPTNDIDVTYNAIDIQRMNATTGSGFLDIVSSDISVSGMTVTIQPQRACIDGITVNAKEAVQIPIDNGLSQLRTDLIVLRKTQSTASADYFVKKGELGSTTPPSLEQVEMGIYEIPICSIRINANQTTLELSNITDLRNYLSRERDKSLPDNGTTINPLLSASVVLTNENNTRLVSQGLWEGQSIFIKNSTANLITLTVPDGANTRSVFVSASEAKQLYWLDGTWQGLVNKNTYAKWQNNGTWNVMRSPWVVTGTKESDWGIEFNAAGVVEKTEGFDGKGTRDGTGVQDGGVPNITGAQRITNGYALPASYEGAFYGEASAFHASGGSQTSLVNSVFGINASRSSALYGNSDNITPRNILVRWYIYKRS